jgi:hypothetical protein
MKRAEQTCLKHQSHASCGSNIEEILPWFDVVRLEFQVRGMNRKTLDFGIADVSDAGKRGVMLWA